MGLLEGKNALIFGLANERSIAWGITQAFKREGANLGISYAGEMLERRVKPLAEQVDCKWVEECDVTKDDQIALTAEKASKHFGKIDVLVHSIAFAGREELSRPYYETSREGFKNAMDISVFSLVALTNAFLPILNPNASIMCLTYYGSVKVAPHYNVMGVAKAALESSTRYLAYDLGPQKIRVNAISAGPIRTLAATRASTRSSASIRSSSTPCSATTGTRWNSVSPPRRPGPRRYAASSATWQRRSRTWCCRPSPGWN